MLYDPFSKGLCPSLYFLYIYKYTHPYTCRSCYAVVHSQFAYTAITKRSLYFLKIIPSSQIRSLVDFLSKIHMNNMSHIKV